MGTRQLHYVAPRYAGRGKGRWRGLVKGVSGNGDDRHFPGYLHLGGLGHSGVTWRVGFCSTCAEDGKFVSSVSDIAIVCMGSGVFINDMTSLGSRRSSACQSTRPKECIWHSHRLGCLKSIYIYIYVSKNENRKKLMSQASL